MILIGGEGGAVAVTGSGQLGDLADDAIAKFRGDLSWGRKPVIENFDEQDEAEADGEAEKDGHSERGNGCCK